MLYAYCQWHAVILDSRRFCTYLRSISTERRLPLSDGRVRSKFQFDTVESVRTRSPRRDRRVTGVPTVTRRASRRTSVSTRIPVRDARPGLAGLSANLFFSNRFVFCVRVCVRVS